MIDWLTMKCDHSALNAEAMAILRQQQGAVYKVSPDGVIEWASPSRAIVRSDSHQIQVHLTKQHLLVMGSPARVVSKDNVFGSQNIIDCATRMLSFVEGNLWLDLPAFDQWRVTRLDITHNYDMDSAANVRQALMILRHAHGGRYQVNTQSESIYWSIKSKNQSGKAYHKGAHLEYQRNQGAEFTDEEIALAMRLLRLELKLGSKWWSQTATKPWHEYTEEELNTIHARYFSRLIGNCEVTEMTDTKQQCIDAAKALGFTEGRGKAAYLYWCQIMSQGYETCRANTPPTSHNRNVRIMMQAGLSFADFQAGRIVALRRKALVLAQPVTSWDQLRAA